MSVNRSSSFVDTDVREIFEKHTVEDTRGIHRKVNHEIERKKEELRMLVGERYRDLIDAADTIGTMKTSSTTVYHKLSSLRTKLNSLPAQLAVTPSSHKAQGNGNMKLSKQELEIAAELKLSLEVPQQVQHCLEKDQLLPAFHLSLLFARKLTSTRKSYKWTFLNNSGQDLDEICVSIASSLLAYCEDALDNVESSPQKLSECFIIKENLAASSCEQILSEWLVKRIQFCESLLRDKSLDFVQVLSSTIQALYQVFIDPELYNSAAKNVRKPDIDVGSFGFIFKPNCVDEFCSESIQVEEPPRASKLAEIIMSSFIASLKTLLGASYVDAGYLQEYNTLAQLHEYRQSTTNSLKQDCEDMMRIVLGTSTSLWSYVFLPVFELKAQAVATDSIVQILEFLRKDGFPKFETADSHFDLINFIWKASAVSDKATLEEDLKMKCLSPNVAELCSDLEEKFQALLSDFQYLGDTVLSQYISDQIISGLQNFIQGAPDPNKVGNSGTDYTTDWLIGRFSTALIDLCPTLWKLLEKNDAIKLKQSLHQRSEKCWMQWTASQLDQLGERLNSMSPDTIPIFMPVAEVYKSEAAEGEEVFEPSVRIPLQLSHILHTILFSICLEISKVGPQSIPKNVKDSLRLSLGQKLIQFYEKFVQGEEGAKPLSHLTPQIAIQFIFDIKFIQWFHPNLSGSTDSLVLQLKTLVDPFDWDIVNTRLTVNLKRFLFENHLTLGLLFSEESHGFIAQNFKTRQNQSFPEPIRSLLYNQLPLLPI